MEHSVWNQLHTYPGDIPSMLATEEKQYLFWLTRSFWTGQGDIVEIGPWLGGSTVCLAAGMKMSKEERQGRLHVIDNFIWRDFMSARMALPIQPGDSFQPYFERNVDDYRDLLMIYREALPDEEIVNDLEAREKRFHESGTVSIFTDLHSDQFSEIVFVDGAKSWRGMAHLMKCLRHRLIPEKSYLVCQDYKYWGTYWVPIMMETLHDYLTPVHNVIGGTTVTFGIKSEIPSGLVDSFENSVYELSKEVGVTFLNRASARLHQDRDRSGAMNVLLSKVSFLAHQNQIELAVKEFCEIQKRWPLAANPNQLEQAREYLRNEKSTVVPRTTNIVLFQYLHRLRKKLRHLTRTPHSLG